MLPPTVKAGEGPHFVRAERSAPSPKRPEPRKSYSGQAPPRPINSAAQSSTMIPGTFPGMHSRPVPRRSPGSLCFPVRQGGGGPAAPRADHAQKDAPGEAWRALELLYELAGLPPIGETQHEGLIPGGALRRAVALLPSPHKFERPVIVVSTLDSHQPTA